MTTCQDIYLKGEKVQVEVVIPDDNGAVGDASVTFLIEFTSTNVTKTVVTDASGEAVVIYKINTRKTGTGTANVTVTVTKAGYDDVVETTSFEVQ